MPFSEPAFEIPEIEEEKIPEEEISEEKKEEALKEKDPSPEEGRSEILKEYLGPDGEANENFVALCSQMFTPMAQKILGRNYQDSIEDMVQEATFKAARHLKDFRRESALKSWLFRIGYNEALDFLRTMNRRRDISGGDPLDEILENSKHLSVPASQERKLLADELVDAMLSCLDERQRHVIELFYIEGHSLKEVGDIMGVDANRVKMWLFKDRKKMIEYAKGKGMG